nr:hypothetical protein [Bacteroides sp.]
MKAISLENVFITPTSDTEALRALARRNPSMAELRHTLADVPFNTAYDFFRAMAKDRIERGEIDRAITIIRETDALLLRAGVDEGARLDMHAALMQVLTALQIEQNDYSEALVTAATTLSLLSQEPKRKDEPFLSVLGSLLYDIAFLHGERSEFKQAERELEKSIKIFERLAKTQPERYGSAVIMAQNAATSIYRSRVKQVNLLAHYQVATSTYLQMVNSGIEDSMVRLVDSLYTEGKTLAQMGRNREAVQYFTRALKYLTKMNPVFDLRQLEMSIDLGEALLQVPASRDKGIHLLNTMLHKATKINAEEAHRRIVDILLNAKSRRLDILGLWHKIFPK